MKQIFVALFFFISVQSWASHADRKQSEQQVGLALDRDEKRAIMAFCIDPKAGKFTISSQGEHRVKTNGEILRTEEDGIVCRATSTKMGMAKKDIYNVKFSPYQDQLERESRNMKRMNLFHMDMAIQCKWGCKPDHTTILTPESDTDFIKEPEYAVLAMEEFVGTPMSQWLRDWSISQTSMLESDDSFAKRMGLLSSTEVMAEVKQVYLLLKTKATEFFNMGYVHKRLIVGNILFNQQTNEVKFIHLDKADQLTKLDFDPTTWNVKDDMIIQDYSPLQWIELVMQDFQTFAESFAWALICPELHLRRDEPGVKKARTRCPGDDQKLSSIKTVMNALDGAYTKANAFLESTPRNPEKLPDVFFKDFFATEIFKIVEQAREINKNGGIIRASKEDHVASNSFDNYLTMAESLKYPSGVFSYEDLPVKETEVKSSANLSMNSRIFLMIAGTFLVLLTISFHSSSRVHQLEDKLLDLRVEEI